jgi:phosphotransferase system HPr (HPr) family protein
MPAQEINVVITNQVGLHARPARLLVQTAAQFRSQIQLQKGDQAVNGKSIVGILKLGAVLGDTITMRADGEDAEEALKALGNLVEQKFHEED